MTKLNCSAIHCANNSEGCCCRPEIKVSGADACECNETCCSSFLKENSAASNYAACKEPNASCDIRCSVKNCVHYKNEKCCADAIMVNGAAACCKTETECSTFLCR